MLYVQIEWDWCDWGCTRPDFVQAWQVFPPGSCWCSLHKSTRCPALPCHCPAPYATTASTLRRLLSPLDRWMPQSRSNSSETQCTERARCGLQKGDTQEMIRIATGDRSGSGKIDSDGAGGNKPNFEWSQCRDCCGGWWSDYGCVQIAVKMLWRPLWKMRSPNPISRFQAVLMLRQKWLRVDAASEVAAC